MRGLIRLITIATVVVSSNLSNADAICSDGWKSKSEGSGTCSWHGGVKEWKPDGTYWVSGYGPSFNENGVNSKDSSSWRDYVPSSQFKTIPERLIDWISD